MKLLVFLGNYVMPTNQPTDGRTDGLKGILTFYKKFGLECFQIYASLLCLNYSFIFSFVCSEPEALYIHLLFGLMDENLGIIESNFASTVYTGFKVGDEPADCFKIFDNDLAMSW